MTASSRTRWVVAVAILAAIAGVAVQIWRIGDAKRPVSPAVEQLLSSEFPDLQGIPQMIGQWRGKVVVVNYWATWCGPCQEEVPIFVKLQRNYGEKGLIFVGIAIDQPAQVKSFARDFGVNYPLLIGDLGAIAISRALGNNAEALPFTVILDRQGKIAATQLGVLKEPELTAIVKRLL